MVGHQAELQDADLGVVGVDMYQLINDRVAEVGAEDGGLGRVVIGDVEVAEERFAVRGDERHVIDADTAPCSSIFLPMPRFCHRSEILCKGTKNNRDTQINREKNEGPA